MFIECCSNNIERTEACFFYFVVPFNIESRIDSLCSVAEVKHGLPPMAAQAIISVDSCIAKRRPFCGFEKLKPVGFCVVCAFCGNYIQKNYR